MQVDGYMTFKQSTFVTTSCPGIHFTANTSSDNTSVLPASICQIDEIGQVGDKL
ncbi:hypothetical protein Psta_3828 [Pirellula staleyi DSM 6068]|uniref:Uncharacterized protein n=1 Tax=Pirellula staleyi (strain ATCC 27377 / DSM 6068 / ICPB 4128) TaxID=530564 RepID=D2R0Z8_PIRSD|nr:hypothetical protein Psta_3828 [Pirellula staleyi DSM 6068]